MNINPFKKISESPTNPRQGQVRKSFEIADLYQGPAATGVPSHVETLPLDEKLRKAYFWVVNTAIISPYYDIEYNDRPAQEFIFGDQKTLLHLPSAQSYSSFILLPLLNFAARRRCLLVGGPGRGKTASAILMAILGGYTLKEIRRAIQHGQPQMTIADLLGNPLPSALVGALSMDEIKIAWRKWLGMRIKIIDEYNRIPTRTQSALLTVMADDYAEILDQTFDCPEAAWYLTANDDAGGGTYQVIEALRDRIDIVVKAPHFNTRFLVDLLARIEQGVKPEEVVPPEIVFNADECDRMHADILAVDLPEALRRRVEFFASQFEFCEPAGEQFEYKTKDTLKLAGADFQQVEGQETGKDRFKDLGSQTKNGLSVRALMTGIVFVKAAAFFRGDVSVSLEDIRQMLPFVLHDKLIQNADSPFFDVTGHAVYRIDKISWIRKMFDLACAEYDRLDLDKSDVVAQLSAEFGKGLEGLPAQEVRARLARIERVLADWSKGRKVYGHLFDDILKLKYLHQRYTNYLHWTEWKN